MVEMQHHAQESRNSSARTADWIGQVKGHVVYAYDLRALPVEDASDTQFARQHLVRRAADIVIDLHRDALKELEKY